MKFGLLLPHFGAYADRERLLQGSRLAEELGFDSVWVRDHLLFEPHGEMESASNSFYDALTTLTAIGAVTERIELGTGSLIPFRHPLQTALVVATMTHLFGPRVIVGMGAGTFDHEFAAIGMDMTVKERTSLVRSNALILKQVFARDDVTYEDENFRFAGVTIAPKPTGPVPFWYCGATPASARRAVEYCDGWMPGRTTLETIAVRVEAMRKLSSEAGRPMPTVAVIPPTSIDEDHDRAFQGMNVEGLLTWANERGKWWARPPSGRFETADDIRGSLIAGTPDEVVAELHEFERVGVEHLVFDLRFRFDAWFESIELLGREVLPRAPRSASVGTEPDRLARGG
jgi:alkanesulfonate monooxygenase SsuD/methylene tetrahydromethanopterin reductase-like flavin-dependent oxidoreductase (luciferase family)